MIKENITFKLWNFKQKLKILIKNNTFSADIVGSSLSINFVVSLPYCFFFWRRVCGQRSHNYMQTESKSTSIRCTREVLFTWGRKILFWSQNSIRCARLLRLWRSIVHHSLACIVHCFFRNYLSSQDTSYLTACYLCCSGQSPATYGFLNA